MPPKLEHLPKWLLCVPLVLQWLWLGLRHGSVTLPTAANPGITAGGLVGEGKLEYFAGMGSVARAATVPFFAVRCAGAASLAPVLEEIQQRGFTFPIIVKPDIGWCGYGVRKVDDAAALAAYLAAFPAGEQIIVQRYLPEECEAGIFYVRAHDAPMGQITGITLRSFPCITGDGVHSIRQLLAADARMARAAATPMHSPDYQPDSIPAKGRRVRLATIGSTRVGGLYSDGSDLITPQLSQAVERIARDMPGFQFGRFDVRFTSTDDLRAGRGFTIMEVNGAGSESIHAWDPRFSLWQGYGIIFAKQKALFAIAAESRRRGNRPVGLRKLAALHFRQQRLIRQYPPSN